jgi:trehalose 6-phosphate phosphatase
MTDERVAALVHDPDHAAVLIDFDGTLAAIDDDPAAVVPWPGVPELLAALTRRFAVAAVVSGRPAAFLVGALGTEVRISGLYGLESVDPGTDGRVDVAAGAGRWGSVVAAEADRLEADAPPGVFVERKGLSLTVHYRNAPDEEPAVEQAVREAASRSGLDVHRAKRSLELRPPVPADKGSVVADLAAGCAAVCYVGDDVGDLPAFAALDTLSAEGVTTLKVVVYSTELDPEVEAAADLTVDGPEGAVAFLEALSKGEAPDTPR